MDIIAAISTGNAATAIGVVRISGDGCFALCDRLFRPLYGGPLSAQPPRKMIYGDVLDPSGDVLDRALAVRFPGPNSYTGEDSAEFHCHGSPVVLREVLRSLFELGARQALPGEFTKRAFLSGQMDLTQAEAVIDLIHAETAAAAKNAIAQLDGALRRPLEQVQNTLLDVASRFYAVVDYPDEDIEDISPEEVQSALETSETVLARLLATCGRGRILKSGVRTAIVGRPNAGKSSLLNALAGYERAIVTDIPGTTRDTVEESVLCGGTLLRLMDTAGLRDTEDIVEKMGVERSRAAMQSADLILAVADGADFAADDLEILRTVSEQNSPWILICAKKDLGGSIPDIAMLSSSPAAVIQLSSVTGEGIDQLESAVAELFPAGNTQDASSLLTDARQEDAVSRALTSIRRAKAAMEAGLTPDAILTDAEDALNALGELTGRTAREDIVSTIFSRFCVGK
ncbi:MAG: tRNA uridine-5-carboxymethylaminomethyl(34) synthesis GTPase MnmE [Ruminococcaceae bacterium]|nr:tRNA uridine-5-carboxymethylaminomethyl(34) synthesis GTPase MnmE [Oscillospiraceae bacterium]